MSKETKDTSFLPTTLGQNDVPKMLEMVKNQIKAIKGELPEQPRTVAVSLPGFGVVNKIDTVSVLLKAASVIVAKEKAYKEAAAIVMPVGEKIPPFKLEGISKDDWLADIKDRLVVVANKTKLDKLSKIKKTLEDNLSAEAKLANDLANIKNMLIEEDSDE